MGILTQDLLLRGSRGETTRMALFDSGASYSIIRRDIAETLGDLARLPEAWEFETAAADHLIVATHAIRLDFFFADSEHRFSDEFIVFDDCSEEIVIGATTMQKWQIKLDFGEEQVVYRKTAEKLRVV